MRHADEVRQVRDQGQREVQGPRRSAAQEGWDDISNADEEEADVVSSVSSFISSFAL